MRNEWRSTRELRLPPPCSFCSAPMNELRYRAWRCTPDACKGATVFRTASSTDRTCSVKLTAMVGIAPTTFRLTGVSATAELHGSEMALPARLALASLHSEDGCLGCSATGAWISSGIGRAPQCCPERLPLRGYASCASRFGLRYRAWRSWSQARRIAAFRARVENWRTLAVMLRRCCLDRALCCYYTKGPEIGGCGRSCTSDV